ncbi:WecB/TagA/CpsF family glycosyltransferase [Gloeocapsa sp. PCC 73106]|uniref:WecB/TagA/CpsF family glycosyltransferase n=1 Tax=Gloeocapsa sp. PCC 73106 TaxID=102232 RepID=UPI0002ACFCC5|nr:WecB/TagA/CpsF family glycosyltransferase [Gloeocapsa sp. PCC 73106]ELR97489.1 exopolysaccharide biosynthesis protein, WecB/TagA/CpsF family [Gloeocapsa sp. PCC 73106]
METVRLLNILIDNISLTELLEKLTQSGGFVVTPNVDYMVKLQREPDLWKAYQVADYRTCDSKILEYAFKFLGNPIKEKISGSDLFPAFYTYNKDNENMKIYLLGAQEGVGQKAQAKINQKVGRNMVIETYSPPFGFEKSESECEEIIRKINQSEANVLVMGVGAPKQEKWIMDYRERLPKVKVFLAIGATIDFEAGFKPRSPKWMSNVGLEWLYRLLSEPKRLWKRYLIDSLPFFGMVMQHKFSLFYDYPQTQPNWTAASTTHRK